MWKTSTQYPSFIHIDVKPLANIALLRVASEKQSEVGVYDMVLKFTIPKFPGIKPSYELFDVQILDKAAFAGNLKPYFTSVNPIYLYIDPTLEHY